MALTFLLAQQTTLTKAKTHQHTHTHLPKWILSTDADNVSCIYILQVMRHNVWGLWPTGTGENWESKKQQMKWHHRKMLTTWILHLENFQNSIHNVHRSERPLPTHTGGRIARYISEIKKFINTCIICWNDLENSSFRYQFWRWTKFCAVNQFKWYKFGKTNKKFVCNSI